MMRVGLLNLGDAPRIFHNKLNRPVVAPIGQVVIADLAAHTVQGLKYPVTPETVLVCDPDAEVPEEMQRVVDLLASIDFEPHEVAIRKFFEIAPPNNIGRPSRMQIRMALRIMVEDYIQAQSGRENIIRDDVDPRRLQREIDEEERPPIHPIVQDRIDREKAIQEQQTIQPAPVPEVPLKKPAVSKQKKAAGSRRR